MAAPLPDWHFTVQPEWIDYNGHMNMGFYVVAFDIVGTDQLFEWLGIGEDYITEHQMSVFTLSSSTDYLGEMFEGAPGSIRTRLLDWDAKRVHYFHEMFDADERLVATNELLCMNVALSSRRSAPFPADVRDRLAAVMQHHRQLPQSPTIGRVMGIRR